MYVIRLANGNLLVPDSVISDDGQLMSEVYVEIGPEDAEYERLAADALTQEQYDARRRSWQEGDESLRQEFLDFMARHGGATQGGPSHGSTSQGGARHDSARHDSASHGGNSHAGPGHRRDGRGSDPADGA